MKRFFSIFFSSIVSLLAIGSIFLISQPAYALNGYCWCQTPGLNCENHTKNDAGAAITTQVECNQYCSGRGFVATNFDPGTKYIDRAGKATARGACPEKTVNGYCWCQTPGLDCENHTKDDQGQPILGQLTCEAYCQSKGYVGTNWDKADQGYIDRSGKSNVNGQCQDKTPKGACWCQTPALKCENHTRDDRDQVIAGKLTCETYCTSHGNVATNWDDPYVARVAQSTKAGECPPAPVTGTASTSTAAGGSGSSIELYNPLGKVNFFTFIGRLIRGVIGVIGALALLIFVYGGLLWILSHGDASMVKKGRTIMKNAVIGMLIIFGSYSAISLFFSLFSPL